MLYNWFLLKTMKTTYILASSTDPITVMLILMPKNADHFILTRTGCFHWWQPTTVPSSACSITSLQC